MKEKPAEQSLAEIRIEGNTIMVPSTVLGGLRVVVTGRWLKKAFVMDEDLVENHLLDNPELFIAGLKRGALRADYFTFAQKVPDMQPKFRYPFEWDNSAVVPISTYKEWLEKRVEYDVRKAVKKAAKLGVVTKIAEFNDALIQGIVNIYNESSTRQGTAFWHYHKDFETVKHECGTYLEKSEFIGAYFQDELIGFIKMAYVGKVASTIHVIAMKKHFDKKATNFLLAKAVELCEQKGATHLVYGKYIYNDPTSSLTEFKRRNGFEKVLLPRYYIPLTLKGRLALALGLQHGLGGAVPEPVKKVGKKVRAALYSRRLASEKIVAKPTPEAVAQTGSKS